MANDNEVQSGVQDNLVEGAEGGQIAATPEKTSEKSPVDAIEGDIQKKHDAHGREQVDDKVTRMGSASIWRLLFEFAIPAIAGTLVNAAYNLISTIFLGTAMGPIGIAAMQVAAPIMIVFMACSMLVGAGGNALAALLLGEGKRDRAELVLGNTVTLSLFISVIVAIAALVPASLNMILDASSATAEVRPYAADYIRIICLGFIFQCIGFGVNNFIRTCGKPNRALLTMVSGAVSCIIFNYFFVMVFGWGVIGSALATIMGQAVNCFSVLHFFVLNKETPLRLRWSKMKPDVHIDLNIITLGAASFFVQLGAAVLTFVTNMLLVKYGAIHPIGEDAALASIGLVQRVAMFAVMPLIGVSIAAQPLLGFNYGARLFKRVRETWLDAIILATIFAVLMWALAHLFPRQIVNLFGITDEGLVEFTIFAMQVQLLAIPIVGFQIVGSNYFQATGQPAKSILLSLSRQVLFLLPCMIILPEWLPTWTSYTGLDAIYIATPVSDIMATVLTLIFVLIELKRLAHIEKHEPAPEY